MSSSARNTKLAYCALLASLALIFSYVEQLFPLPIPVPGIKLGIANLVIIIAIYRFGFKYTLAINLIRVFISGLLFSGAFGIIYSLAGATLSMIVMFVLYKTRLFSMVGISMAGGVFHNLGQLAVACFIVSNVRLFSYFSVLLFSGLISGIAIGILAYTIEKRLPKR